MPSPLLQYRRRPTTELIILHDSHTPPSMDRGVDYLMVQGRERGLLSIGYNFVIERSGLCVETRPFECIGSHTFRYNHRSVGVCLVGGLGKEEGVAVDNFTGAQRFALEDLVFRLRVLYPQIPIVGHSEVDKRSQCPACNMEQIRESVHRCPRLRGGC